ncbi:MAG: sigma-70 family RNA polymerase sigma factor [Planctomycetales bacterium]|nr:sigma-70 family RNA polymerase sigma factor [Planctomycetales bacterium]
MSTSEQLHDSFSICIDQLRCREESAATKIWQRFAPQLRQLVNSRLTSHTQSVLDSDDVLQSAFKSFFHRFHQDQFDLRSWFAIWQLLVTITDRKCIQQARHFHASKRSVEKTVLISRGEDIAHDNREQPADNAIFAETLQRLFETRSDSDRDILWCYLRGVESREIAQELKISQRSVQRAIWRAIQWLETQSLESSSVQTE